MKVNCVNKNVLAVYSKYLLKLIVKSDYSVKELLWSLQGLATVKLQCPIIKEVSKANQGTA